MELVSWFGHFGRSAAELDPELEYVVCNSFSADEVSSLDDSRDLFNLYDRGKISGRELMQALVFAMAPSVGFAQPSTSIPASVGQTVNHVQIMVRDLAASADFYAKLVGATREARNSPDTVAMVMPGNRSSVLTWRLQPWVAVALIAAGVEGRA